MTSRIAIRPRNKHIDPGIGKTSGIGGDLFQHCESTRTTEQTALDSMSHVPELTPLHRRIADLEKITRDPKLFPTLEVINRPSRAIYGGAALSWIGKQPGVKMTASEVKTWIGDIERIYARRAAHGLID